MALEALSNYFLNPLGLLGLLALLPLLAFYFFRPEPEERVMPSMTFFMENRKSGTIEKAMQKFRKNLLLLLHILMILGFAAALANLYMEGEGRPENAVIVFDRSASMADDMRDAKAYVGDNLGEENTLIVVGEEAEVVMEDVSGARVESYLSGVAARDVETDIAAGLSLASEYRGTIVAVSDLDQTVSQRSAADILKQMSSEGRPVRLFHATRTNMWGIVGVNPGKSNTTVEVKNFQETRESIRVAVNGEAQQLVVEPESTSTITFSPAELNRVELAGDTLSSDNVAYVSVPPDRTFGVTLVGDNPYLEKAVELIGFTSVTQVQPPVENLPDSEVYIVGETDIGAETANAISSEVSQGASLVAFARPGIEDSFPFLPAVGEPRNVSVEILEPRRVNVGTTVVHRLNGTSGERLADPGDALVKTNHGRGEVLLYNIRDEDFRYDFLYPVFWKDMMEDLTDRPSIEELNVRTGETINESWVETPDRGRVQGATATVKAGFYNTSRHVYAANLVSEDESDTEKPGVSPEQVNTASSDRTYRDVLAMLLVFASLGELVYLRRSGVV